VLSTAGVAALTTQRAFPYSLTSLGERDGGSSGNESPAGSNLYAELLKTWCDGLLDHQLTGIRDPALAGGFLCPACCIIHGRCSDAVYPLLRMAKVTGSSRYLEGALRVYDWTEQQVSQSDGSWINDVTLEPWQGITVFRAIALAEALRHYGSLLDAATSRRWTDRLARALKFLDGFITIETGDINYPVSASYCFALCGQVLGDSHYSDRGQKLVHTCLEYLTPNHLIFGEGHPIQHLSPKRFRPVDLGYNVEESLPSLALYATLTQDKDVLAETVAALRSHMEFMLPDGGWDNSWGCRNYKWTWWGSRTSDGCHPAYILMAEHDPRFREVAQRNLELMAACTHMGLLYGGPDYFIHGDMPCIHHTFTHAKALTTVLDNDAHPVPDVRVPLPRDEPYGLRSFPEIGTHLAAIGMWRATVTEYDWKEPGEDQGHVTGGSLSLLFHRRLGPILVASMTEYERIEIINQQAFRDTPHMALTPRVECVSDQTYTSFSDFDAVLKVTDLQSQVAFDARGQLLTTGHAPFPQGGVQYHMTYLVADPALEITAHATAPAFPAQLRFVLPVVSQTGERVEQDAPASIRIIKPGGSLSIHTDAPRGFGAVPNERTFNLVPGFECLPLIIPMEPGEAIRIRLEASSK
jgi:hypothetical protein